MINAPEILFPCDAILGEGVNWDPEEQLLWWVDILGKMLFCGNPANGHIKSWPQDQEIGAALPAPNRKRALVMRDHVDLFDPSSGERHLFWKGEELPTNRFNDAGTDRLGNLWITSMDFDATAPTGALWRVTPQGKGRRVITGYPCLNGPVFSPDNLTLYMGDTMNGRVLAYDHDPATGDLTNERVFVDLGAFGGLSDGMAIDVEGCLWLSRVTAGRITRYAPDGSALATIAVPVPMVTSCTFGGVDMSTLYMTTARIIMDDIDLAAYPDSGAVFAVEAGVKGCKQTVFQINPDTM